jgi:hypothetical protein
VPNAVEQPGIGNGSGVGRHAARCGVHNQQATKHAIVGVS